MAELPGNPPRDATRTPRARYRSPANPSTFTNATNGANAEVNAVAALGSVVADLGSCVYQPSVRGFGASPTAIAPDWTISFLDLTKQATVTAQNAPDCANDSASTPLWVYDTQHLRLCQNTCQRLVTSIGDQPRKRSRALTNNEPEQRGSAAHRRARHHRRQPTPLSACDGSGSTISDAGDHRVGERPTNPRGRDRAATQRSEARTPRPATPAPVPWGPPDVERPHRQRSQGVSGLPRSERRRARHPLLGAEPASRTRTARRGTGPMNVWVAYVARWYAAAGIGCSSARSCPSADELVAVRRSTERRSRPSRA